jgi:hypothetical protein
MPPELSITFSRGQEKTSDSAQATVPVVASDSPIFVHGEGHFGATQPSPSASTFSSPQPSLASPTLADVTKPTIPTGVTFPPRLKLAVAGSTPKLKTRQLWEGTVTEVKDNGFVAVLSDKTNVSNPEEQGTFEFDKTEISAEDFALIKPGSSFYWIIGSIQTPANQVINASIVQFRRVPTWSERSLRRADERARLLRELFREEA